MTGVTMGAGTDEAGVDDALVAQVAARAQAGGLQLTGEGGVLDIGHGLGGGPASPVQGGSHVGQVRAGQVHRGGSTSGLRLGNGPFGRMFSE